MSQSLLDQLLEMGFDKQRAELAVKRSDGLPDAMDWLEKNQDTDIEELLAEEEAGPSVAKVEGGSVAMSLVCNECDKKFRSQREAEFHANKSGHSDFSESTEEIAPLTEEEKQQRLIQLREKVKAKRANQAIVDKEEQKRNEQIRQKATKESQDLKEELQRKEQIKEAAKKRQEKIDEMEAKKRIKAKIEADKEERRRKAEEAKAAREGKAPPAAAPAPAPAPAATASRPAANHNEARLRLQTPSGNIMRTLPAETTLFEVAQMVEAENGSAVTKFIQNFPRKVFEGNLDFGKTLKEAGLVPSAALVVQ
ncbi:ubiquitin-related domain-containing protein [Xylaria bambusicola]|uniref:ubiquitin-related domain-containing protein n=1 Tax=Xylaria bambusicola TaxID=326684 RepID=UPI0020081935|nr:ubiquitin-related domain-containing protein [Xylaria bambusicola]KAI0509437.1 ubiquitin-related domain-containing protein [Xylaria bambusicola]